MLVERFVSQPCFDPAGFFFVTHRGDTAGTAFAWVPEPGTGRGVVHFVAVHPAHQRRGIGRALVRLVLARLRDVGAWWLQRGAGGAGACLRGCRGESCTSWLCTPRTSAAA